MVKRACSLGLRLPREGPGCRGPRCRWPGFLGLAPSALGVLTSLPHTLLCRPSPPASFLPAPTPPPSCTTSGASRPASCPGTSFPISSGGWQHSRHFSEPGRCVAVAGGGRGVLRAGADRQGRRQVGRKGVPSYGQRVSRGPMGPGWGASPPECRGHARDPGNLAST